MAKMRTMGVSLNPDEIEKMKILMVGDRRSVSWLIREAIVMYLAARADDLVRYAAMQNIELGAAEHYVGHPASLSTHPFSSAQNTTGHPTPTRSSDSTSTHTEDNKGLTGEKE